ncbi:GNAT family N-acetyltransferase [Sphingobacterium sp. HMA12]|uniref:GNAT family N-acetyltransferase n=1 Tax=Sphingobacterium sp. HMA12 TaxID=2050894 RepID=UPI000CEA623B|nr:GNAT family N-acetyltransferase [Sphingobacterium sp. HMA12]
MIRKIELEDYPNLIAIWESAVKSTHDFLKEGDFIYYKEQLPVYFEHVVLLGYVENGALVGFMGISGDNLEMLFVHNDFRGKGIGKILLSYAIMNLNVTRVDVNEQNMQALDFYRYMGFHVIKRSAVDGQGKSYPILHMGYN